MDLKEEHPGVLTSVFEKVFNRKWHYLPDHSMMPKHEGFTETPFQEKPIINPPQDRSEERSVLVNTLFKSTDKRPFFEILWQTHERTTTTLGLTGVATFTPILERTTKRPYTRFPTRYNPIDRRITSRPDHNSIGHSISQPVHSGLEKCLWVVLGGIGVLILMAFFMKLGKPIRRVRRHLSNARPAQDETRVNLNSDDDNLGTGSLLHMSDTTASTASELSLYSDPPPSYTECVRSSIQKHDSEEPPPRYSEVFVTYTNDKYGHPTVHIRLQNDEYVQNNLSEDGLTSECIDKTISANDSEVTALGKKTELVFDNGSLVARPSLELNRNNNETGVRN